MPFPGRAIIVTGASSGIGRALCLELAVRKARLALAARDTAKLDEVTQLCRSRGAEALPVRTDVSSEEDCRNLVERTVEAFGGIDVLVNNAGRTMWARLDEMKDLSLYLRLMQVNYMGCVYPTYYALPHLKAARGRIVVVSSLAGLTGVPTRTGYAATKHALFGFFDSLRIELMGSGVSVTMVAPDFVVSEIHRRAIGPDGQPLGQSPIQEHRIMTAEACARMIVDAMEKRKRLVVGSMRARIGRFARLVAPVSVDRIAARAVRRGK
jgi:short-subunit dehydrogenase